MENLKINKQYNFTCSTLTENLIIDGTFFQYKNNFYITSFVENEKFLKIVFNENFELISFENYFQHNITFGYKDIEFTINLFSQILKNKEYKEENFNIQLLKDFCIEFEPFFIDRNKVKYSFKHYESTQLRHNELIEKNLYKKVLFNSSYALKFNKYEKNYFYLNLFKDNDFFYYCIETPIGDAICKFVFELKSFPDKEILYLIQRENYLSGSEIINFETLTTEFMSHHNPYDMFLDIPDESISYFKSCNFSYLYTVFFNKNLPLLF
jgi:hypothetical protein